MRRANLGVTAWLLALAALHKLECERGITSAGGLRGDGLGSAPALVSDVMRAGVALAQGECSMQLSYWRAQLELLADQGYAECERDDDDHVMWALTGAGRARFMFIAGVLAHFKDLAVGGKDRVPS